MAQVQGKVFKVYDKVFSGKTNYSIKLEDNPIYYRAGGKRWAGIAEPGNVVSFDAEVNDDGKSARITGDVKKAAASPQGAAPNLGGGGARESSIHYQSSRKDALEFVKLAVSVGAIDVGKTKAKQLGVLEAALDRYTAIFFDDIGTLGAVARASEAEGAAEAAGDEDDGEGDEE